MNEALIPETQKNMKRRVAFQFSKAAPKYHVFARIQKQIAERVLRCAAYDPMFVLDIGCGIGTITRQIGQNTVGIDIAKGMLKHAVSDQQTDFAGARRHWVNGDMDQLPFINDVFTHVYSCMALQWSANLRTALSEVYRVLKTNGSASITVPVSGSFWQLQQAYLSGRVKSNLNPLFDADTWQAVAKQVGFRDVQTTTFTETDAHDSLMQLLQSISKIGAGVSCLSGDPLTRKHLATLIQHFPVDKGRFALDYTCVSLLLEK